MLTIFNILIFAGKFCQLFPNLAVSGLALFCEFIPGRLRTHLSGNAMSILQLSDYLPLSKAAQTATDGLSASRESLQEADPLWEDVQGVFRSSAHHLGTQQGVPGGNDN